MLYEEAPRDSGTRIPEKATTRDLGRDGKCEGVCAWWIAVNLEKGGAEMLILATNTMHKVQALLGFVWGTNSTLVAREHI